MEDEDLYKVLGLERGPQVLQVDVRKAYRTFALIWHPDKQVGKKAVEISAAAIQFDKIQKAYEVLGDEKARKAYDELWKLRKSRLEKETQLSAKRQKMMQDLRDRERAFEAEKSERREEELASKRLQAEIARIRALRSKKQTFAGTEYAFDARSSSQSGKSTKTEPGAVPSFAQATEMQSTLKASWASTEGGAGGYTATRLREIFEEYGEVEDVVIRQSKSRRKGSALVVMRSKEAAISATGGPCGDPSNPLLVIPAVPLPSKPAETVLKSQATAEEVASLDHVVGSRYKTYENDVLTKMRQAAERAQLIKKMQEADSGAS